SDVSDGIYDDYFILSGPDGTDWIRATGSAELQFDDAEVFLSNASDTSTKSLRIALHDSYDSGMIGDRTDDTIDTSGYSDGIILDAS
ncbi:hypothetical protein OFN55_37050, partial [Escherichia coli]|nr:hypothetical protein [Escherichia coli]